MTIVDNRGVPAPATRIKTMQFDDPGYVNRWSGGNLVLQFGAPVDLGSPSGREAQLVQIAGAHASRRGSSDDVQCGTFAVRHLVEAIGYALGCKATLTLEDKAR